MTNPAGNSRPLWIDDQAGLQRLIAELCDVRLIGLDTEFIRERTYYPQLCLIQLASDELTACIDALAIDLAPLLELLERTRLIKVLHAARQDLEVLQQTLGSLPVPLFDTQVAAALSGAATQLSYGQLVRERLGGEIDKSQTRTDWARRPLSDRQLRYAADDVRYLPALHDALAPQLESLGRMGWMDEEMIKLADPALHSPSPDSAWERVKGAAGLTDAAALSALAALAAWREREAMRQDLPRQWVVTDPALIALAECRPADGRLLRAIPGIPAELADRHSAAWLEALEVAAGSQRAAGRTPRRLDPVERRRLAGLQKRLRMRAGKLGLRPELLAPRRTLETIACSRSLDVLQGWRREAVGSELRAALEIL